MAPLFWISVLLIAAMAGFLLATYLWISHRANPYILKDTDLLPFRDTALVLGTAKHTRRGGLNVFFVHRMAKAAEVYRASKVRQLLISGADRPPRRPDEVDEICQGLLQDNIPPEALLQDHLGTRTLISLQNCQQTFSTTDPLIISQRFHNQRAIFIALRLGMHPLAIDAKPVKGYAGIRMVLREALARVKCLIDCYCRTAT